MQNFRLPLSFFLLIIFGACEKNEDISPKIPDVPLEKEGYALILNEEFDGKSISDIDLNTSHWLIHENGWKESLLSINNGILTLNAEILNEEEHFTGRTYGNEIITSSLKQAGGVVNSQGLYDGTEGFVEVKARFPKGAENTEGRIMIMSDNWGDWPSGFGQFYASDAYIAPMGMNTFTMFSKEESIYFAQSTAIGTPINYFLDFHTYGIEWKPGLINFYFDGELMESEDTYWIDEETKVYFMIATMMDKNATAPERGMEVDYIRWYKRI